MSNGSSERKDARKLREEILKIGRGPLKDKEQYTAKLGGSRGKYHHGKKKPGASDLGVGGASTAK